MRSILCLLLFASVSVASERTDAEAAQEWAKCACGDSCTCAAQAQAARFQAPAALQAPVRFLTSQSVPYQQAMFQAAPTMFQAAPTYAAPTPAKARFQAVAPVRGLLRNLFGNRRQATTWTEAATWTEAVETIWSTPTQTTMPVQTVTWSAPAQTVAPAQTIQSAPVRFSAPGAIFQCGPRGCVQIQ